MENVGVQRSQSKNFGVYPSEGPYEENVVFRSSPDKLKSEVPVPKMKKGWKSESSLSFIYIYIPHVMANLPILIQHTGSITRMSPLAKFTWPLKYSTE